MPEHVDVPPAGWSAGGCYFVSPSAGEQEGGRDMIRGVAVQYVTIEVPAVAGKMARSAWELLSFPTFACMCETRWMVLTLSVLC
eukprot:3332930-Rhodomonas_salina.1